MELNGYVDMEGYENIYKINKEGKIYSCKFKKLLKTVINQQWGYEQIQLTKNKKRTGWKIKSLLILNFDKTHWTYKYKKLRLDDLD